MSREKKQAKQPGPADLLRLVGLGFLIAAVVKELRTPAPERTWNGTVGFVPYDLRKPTAQRFRDRLWAPEDSRLFTPQPLGVGWTLNLGRLVALLRQRLASRA